MKLMCVFCEYEMEKDLPGPVDVVVCPDCRTKVEIHQENSTTFGQMFLYIKILKEGKKKKR